jgi:hypothetical protein
MIKVRDTEALKCFAALQGFKILPNSNEEVDYEKLIIRRWSNFLNGYSQAFNKQQDRKGSLFRANTKRKLITDDYYFSQLVCYIHQNPVKHGFVKNLDEWEHSSYNSFLSKHNTSLEREAVLDWFGGIEGFKSFHLTDSIIVDEL